MENKEISFDFGENWKDYSKNALGEKQLSEAKKSLELLIGKDKIHNKKIFDLGCGSGIFSIALHQLKAKEVIGIDISKESIQTSLENKERFAPESNIKFLHESIFDEDIKKLGKFDLVYSWGVLHHTGDMWKAIQISSKLIKKNGLLILALYNKHWTSPIWRLIKRFYNLSPKLIQKLMITVFYCVIALAKFLATGKDPFKKERGMSFYYDIVDWLGGYPYEYASKEEVIEFSKKIGLKLIKYIKTQGFTGCNEFIFIKNGKL